MSPSTRAVLRGYAAAPGGSEPEPLFVEEWDFADAATMFALAAYDHTNWGGDVTLVSDPTVPSGIGKVAKCPAGSGVDIYLESAPINLTGPREFWLDAEMKYDSNFKVDWGTSGANPDHKTILFYDSDNTTVIRHDFHFGVFSSNATQIFNVRSDALGHNPYTDTQPDLVNNLWDGAWHRLRLHADLGDTGEDNGTYEIWLDSTKIHEDIGIVPMTVAAGARFVLFGMGRNINQPPSEATNLYWGRLIFHTTDPGW